MSLCGVQKVTLGQDFPSNLAEFKLLVRCTSSVVMWLARNSLRGVLSISGSIKAVASVSEIAELSLPMHAWLINDWIH